MKRISFKILFVTIFCFFLILGIYELHAKNFNFNPVKVKTIKSIDLESFGVRVEQKTVILEWKTLEEKDNIGFFIVRSESLDKDYIILNQEPIPSKGDKGSSYFYIDHDVKAGHLYFYWLADVNIAGGYKIHGPVSIELDSISKITFDTFVPWSKPIEDYRSFAEYWSNGEITDLYQRGIHDLAPHNGKLWFGYGDANYNLGTKMLNYGKPCIEFRYFESPNDPVPFTCFESGEEQIDQYRILDGELWQAGIDSNDPNEASSFPKIQGNVYHLEGEEWIKFRTINGGEHVHDVAFWNDSVYAVGSGADDRDEWEAGNIFRYLWESETNGESFLTVHREGHPEQEGKGDSRWIRLLPLENYLYIFGYYSMFSENRTFVSNALYDGNEVINFNEENQDDVVNIFAYGTLPLPDGKGLLWGVCVDNENGNYSSIWHLDGLGKSTRLDNFDNENIIDVYFHSETEEIVYLLTDYFQNRYHSRILLADMSESGEVNEICQYSSIIAPVSIACWKDKMFLGMNSCEVYKSGNPPYAQFHVTPTTGMVWNTVFFVDASSSYDNQNPKAVLKIRWKWEENGKFTQWTTKKKAQHRYPTAGSKEITLEVIDLDGEISSATRNVTVN